MQQPEELSRQYGSDLAADISGLRADLGRLGKQLEDCLRAFPPAGTHTELTAAWRDHPLTPLEASVAEQPAAKTRLTGTDAALTAASATSFTPPPATFPLPTATYIAYQLSLIFNDDHIAPGKPVGGYLVGGPAGVPALYKLLNGWHGFFIYGLSISSVELMPVRSVGDLVNAIFFSLKRTKGL